jgi:hypothetical protein
MSARQTLSNRRCAETFVFEHAGHRFSLTVGRFSRWQAGRDIFIVRQARITDRGDRTRCGCDGFDRASYGSPLATIASALTKDHDGGPAMLLARETKAIFDKCVNSTRGDSLAAHWAGLRIFFDSCRES